MRKTRKSRFGTFCAAVTTAALVVSAAFVPVAAGSSVDLVEDGAEYLEEFDFSDYEGLSGSTTTELSISGSINAGSLGELELNADMDIVVDHDAGAQSVTGAIKSSGISYEFAEYMDAEAILLKIPGLPKVLSYNYSEVPADSYLVQMLGADTLDALNNALKLMYAGMAGGPDVERYAEEISAIVTDAISQLELEAAPDKDCIVGGETVTCSGYQTVITKDVVQEAFNKILKVTLPNGQTFEEYLNMFMSLAGSASSYSDGAEEVSGAADVASTVNSVLDDMPDFTAAVYLNNDFPVEIDLTAEDETLAIQLRGPEDAPWSEIAVNAAGEDLCVINLSADGSVYTATITAGGSEVATASFDVESMTYELNIAGLGAPITGSVNFEDDAFVFTAAYNGLQLSMRTTAGGTVTKPEGDVLELTTMSEEDFQSIYAGIASLLESSDSSDAAA